MAGYSEPEYFVDRRKKGQVVVKGERDGDKSLPPSMY